MKYILLIFTLHTHWFSANTYTLQEIQFDSKQSCVDAQDALRAEIESFGIPAETICVPR